LHPVDASPLPQIHYNSQNTQKKFGGKKFKKNFKGKWNKKTSIIIRKIRILTKARGLPRKISAVTTLRFFKGVVVTTTSLSSATLP